MGWVSIIEMNRKIKQNRELRKNATKSRLSREKVYYKKSNKEPKEMSPADKAKQRERMQEHRDFIRRRDTITIIASVIALLVLFALLYVFVL